MNAKFACFFIIGSLVFQSARAEEAEERAPDAEPNTKPIIVNTTQTVEGEEETYALESTHRAERIYPSNWGQAGIFRVRSAESLPEGTLTFGVGGEFYSISNSPVPASTAHANTIAESLFLGYAPTRNLTLSVMRRNSSTTFGNPQELISSLGDINFSGLYSFPLSPSVAVAPIANFLIASNFNRLSPSGNTFSVGFGGALTYSLYPSLGTPLYFHANLLYHMPQIRSASLPTVQPEAYFNFSRYDTVTLALGAEYKLGDFIPFMEFTDTIQANSGLSFGNSPSKLSFGSRFIPLENKSLAFLLGFDVGVGKGIVAGTPFNPDYQILGQISYTVGIHNTERKHYYTTKDVNIVDRKFIIRKNVNFQVGKAVLLSESHALLNQIASVIKQNRVKRLLVVGHTDSSHTDDYNVKLSLDRANAVKSYLVGQGIPEEAISTQGYGKRKPRASNLTEAGRALNRRVEFFILE